MTTNLKSQTLINLPVLGAPSDAKTVAKAATAASARKIRIGWLVPGVVVLATVVAYQVLGNLGELNAFLDGLEQAMQFPQF